ncbi:MAG: DUF1624 domain-containing protein [Cytophagia bacterium]|nr:DUF1624 domain-containing protein [Cytophagia bacterium]NBW35345.1 DUF1624 domain-containing protein [Cytophagia bacterium]
MKRLESIDAVRGLVMIIMALDHVRDLMHIDSITQSPTDLTTTTPLLFFTRWITHLCAPIFVFLAGTSVYLLLQKNGNVAEIRKLTIKRGLWLILLEFTLVNFAIFFDVGFNTLLFEVIASTGFGFIMLSLSLKVPSKYVGLLGLVIVCFHNALPLIPFNNDSVIKLVLSPLFNPAAVPLFAGKVFVIGYPPIPWLGIMLLGFATGPLFGLPSEKLKSLFIKIGLSTLLLFFVVRFINIYGDSAPWSIQENGLLTFLSFMNVSKYPPSLVFCLITLSIMFLLLASSDTWSDRVKKYIIVYGKVPLFYFIVHFYLIHCLTILMLSFQGFDFAQLEFATGTFGRPEGVESGLPLWGIYLVWLFVVAILYKPCEWFGRYKATHNHWWLRYI